MFTKLERELDSHEFAPVGIHACNRRFERVLQDLADAVELDLDEAVQIPIHAESRDPLAFGKNICRAAAARGQTRVLHRSEAELFVARHQLYRANAFSAD